LSDSAAPPTLPLTAPAQLKTISRQRLEDAPVIETTGEAQVAGVTTQFGEQAKPTANAARIPKPPGNHLI